MRIASLPQTVPLRSAPQDSRTERRLQGRADNEGARAHPAAPNNLFIKEVAMLSRHGSQPLSEVTQLRDVVWLLRCPNEVYEIRHRRA